MGAILLFIFLLFLPGAIVNALGIVRIAFKIIGFLISAAVTVLVLVGGFALIIALLVH